MSHLINAFPIGRLGNQMFQVAALMGYASKHKCQWGFPSDTREVPNLRKFFPGIPVLDGNFRRFNVSDPALFNYHPIQQFGGDTTLVGFFQSEKYFEGAADKVRELFKLNIQPEYKGYVSIHVRRGDYVQHSNSFPPVNGDYITQALRITCNTNRSERILIFSDDIQWCKENIPQYVVDTGVNFPDEWEITYMDIKSEFEDLSAMASCSHNIIANSTFSWWGAWLNPNQDKIVISPSADNWFGHGFTGSVPKDLIPDSWTQIKFR